LRQGRGRRGVAARQRHSGIRDGQPDEPQAEAPAQAAAASPRNRQVRRQGVGARLHASAATDVLQRRTGEGGDRSGARQAAARQAAGQEEGGGAAGDSAGDVGAEGGIDCSEGSMDKVKAPLRWLGSAILLTAVGALCGYVGSWLVWNYIYGIGGRVISDRLHYELMNDVLACGALAGACTALAASVALDRWKRPFFWIVQCVSVLAGMFGGD